jgi:hypothetical protein
VLELLPFVLYEITSLRKVESERKDWHIAHLKRKITGTVICKHYKQTQYESRDTRGDIKV